MARKGAWEDEDEEQEQEEEEEGHRHPSPWVCAYSVRFRQSLSRGIPSREARPRVTRICPRRPVRRFRRVALAHSRLDGTRKVFISLTVNGAGELVTLLDHSSYAVIVDHDRSAL